MWSKRSSAIMEDFETPHLTMWSKVSSAIMEDFEVFVNSTCGAVHPHLWIRAEEFSSNAGLESGPHHATFKLLWKWRNRARRLAEVFEVVTFVGR